MRNRLLDWKYKRLGYLQRRIKRGMQRELPMKWWIGKFYP